MWYHHWTMPSPVEHPSWIKEQPPAPRWIKLFSFILSLNCSNTIKTCSQLNPHWLMSCWLKPAWDFYCLKGKNRRNRLQLLQVRNPVTFKLVASNVCPQLCLLRRVVQKISSVACNWWILSIHFDGLFTYFCQGSIGSLFIVINNSAKPNQRLGFGI